VQHHAGGGPVVGLLGPAVRHQAAVVLRHVAGDGRTRVLQHHLAGGCKGSERKQQQQFSWAFASNLLG
jgi:hypothetical protein